MRKRALNESSSGENIFHLVQQYPWIDHITVFHLRADGVLERVLGGDMIPFVERRPPARLPTMVLRLRPGMNRLLIRIQSRSEKLIGLRLGPPGRTALPYLSKMHLVMVGAAFIAAFISLLILLVLKEQVALSYLVFLGCLTAMLLSWEGYGHPYLYPRNPYWNSPVLLTVGSLGLWSMAAFWRKLLLMSLQFPVLDRVFRFAGWIALVGIPFNFIPMESQLILERGQLTLLLAFTFLIFWSGFRAIRRGFTPAYFSVIGFFFVVIGFFFVVIGLIGHSFSGQGVIPGGDYTRNGVYFFYLVEFSLFLISIVVRIKYLARIAERAETNPAKPADTDHGPRQGAHANANAGGAVAAGDARSRLEGNNISSLSNRLNHLLRVEKLFADEDLNLERLAGLLGLTRHQLSELFRITFRANYHQTMKRLRVEEARRLLNDEPERNVLSIALAVGYASKSTFNTEFKKQTGLSPSEFRKSASAP